ncbi:uncharacterized protein [Elaeis guineensis]|uniref:Uncharacterized protein LOC114914013 n=1 Tax=Elaeis guineensis var. tenera TaxID=51953 RepID=A0A8N4I858_ELAGV|nr:uncharacterized protein LOC114914013 [Elaeis guineensis]
MELFPSQVYRSIQHYWRRRANRGLEGSSSPSKKVRLVARLGGESRSTKSRRAWKLKSAMRPIPRLRIKVLSPLRLLARMRDAYMDAMLALAGGGGRPSALNKSRSVSDGRWERRIPKARQMSARRGDFERRLMIHIYNALVAPPEVPGNHSVN